jgi:hypothetical protein
VVFGIVVSTAIGAISLWSGPRSELAGDSGAVFVFTPSF